MKECVCCNRETEETWEFYHPLGPVILCEECRDQFTELVIQTSSLYDLGNKFKFIKKEVIPLEEQVIE